MEKKLKVMIVEDHHIFRKGLKMLLREMPEVTICGEAVNGQEFLDTFEKMKPDIIFMDIQMPVLNGIEATKEALRRDPELKIVAISMFGEEEYLVSMLEAGVKGFLLKTAEEHELKKALTLVADNKNYFSDELIPTLTTSLVKSRNKEEPREPELREELTRREVEVLELICKGYTIKEIADKLFISQRTVDGHKANLFRKAGVDSSVKLVTFAIKNGLYKV
ncbi:MAG: response regulator transcription factor [Bacteroidales bacterium]|nr:response regulator transcription factor [Bacteroidales bacterium]NLM92149.1 response regulator transcription factor [Bacteroidales bacterium]